MSELSPSISQIATTNFTIGEIFFGPAFSDLQSVKMEFREYAMLAWERHNTALKKSGAKPLNKKQLAKEMGTVPSQVTQLFEGDRAWNSKWVDRFCAALKITPEDVFCLRAPKVIAFPYFDDRWLEVHNTLEAALVNADPSSREMLRVIVVSAAEQALKKEPTGTGGSA